MGIARTPRGRSSEVGKSLKSFDVRRPRAAPLSALLRGCLIARSDVREAPTRSTSRCRTSKEMYSANFAQIMNICCQMNGVQRALSKIQQRSRDSCHQRALHLQPK